MLMLIMMMIMNLVHIQGNGMLILLNTIPAWTLQSVLMIMTMMMMMMMMMMMLISCNAML